MSRPELSTAPSPSDDIRRSTPETTQDVHPLFHRESAPPDPEYAREVAHAKRFCERHHGDAAFRAAVRRDAQAAIDAAGIAGTADDYRPLFDPVAWRRHLENPAASPRALRRLLAFNAEKAAWRSRLRNELRVDHPGLHAWRRRQILRCFGQLPTENAEYIVHAPVSFELCRGCSVGCWFCGISAGRLSAVWRYEAHREEWRNVLAVVREVVGDAGRLGFCYWGTDPFDNPDYEQFCRDHHEILGAFPHTTTAMADRDLTRARQLLALSQAHGCKLNRFSVLSLGALNRIHAAFTAEEMLYVDLALQHAQSQGAKTRAGKVLARARRAEEILAEDAGETVEVSTRERSGRSTLPTSQASTIACVSGFQLNLVDRRVRLISPCPASERWPDGYRVHAEAHYESPDDLRQVLKQMTSPETLQTFLSARSTVKLREDVKAIMQGDDLLLQGPFRTIALPVSRHPYASALAPLLTQDATVEAVALTLEREVGASLDRVFEVLNSLHSLGLLDDEPTDVPETNKTLSSATREADI